MRIELFNRESESVERGGKRLKKENHEFDRKSLFDFSIMYDRGGARQAHRVCEMAKYKLQKFTG
jgi:hypothetical protein